MSHTLEIAGFIVDCTTSAWIEGAQVEALVAIGDDTASLSKVNTKRGRFTRKLEEEQ